MDAFGLTTIQTVFNSPKSSSGLSVGSPLIRPHNTQAINKALKLKINRVGEDPYLPEFVKTLQNRYPHVTLAVGSNFASYIARNRRSDRRKFREKLEPLSLKIPSFLSLSFSLSILLLPTGWESLGQDWDKRLVISMQHVQL